MVKLKKPDKHNVNFNALPGTFEKAKTLRENQTVAENLLWNHLRNSKLKGIKFRHQHPIGMFIADFYCHKARLVVEVDGKIHNKPDQKEYDYNRSKELERLGIEVLRFENEDILYDIYKVLHVIALKAMERIKLLTSP